MSYTKASATKLHDRLVELTRSDVKQRMEIAECVYELYYGAVEIGSEEVELWRFLGFRSWFDYIETTGLHVSTAANYRLVWDKFGIKLKGKWDQSLNVSFTKLRALCPVVDEKNVNAWLKRAESMTCCKLDDEVFRAVWGVKRNRPARNFMAKMTDSQLQNINKVLELAQEQFPHAQGRGELLSKIIGQWSAAVRQSDGIVKKLRAVG